MKLRWRFQDMTAGIEATVENGADIKRRGLNGRRETEEEKRTNPDELRSRVTYHELLPGVSVQYELDGSSLKENIILADKGALDRAVLEFTSDTLNFELAKDGSLYAIDDRTGVPEFSFLPPYTVDANGVCIDARPVLETVPGGARLWYQIDEAVLNTAAYPITIDPVVKTRSTGEGQAENAHYAVLCSDNSTMTTGAINVGTSGAKEYVTALKFGVLPEITAADTVVSAKLKLTRQSSSGSNYLSAHEILRPWNTTQLPTWNTLNPYNASHVVADALDCVKASGSTMTWDITNVYRKWFRA